MGQAISAVAVVAALGLGLMAFNGMSSGYGAGDEPDPKPATCSGGKAEKGDKAAGRVSGAQLCKALNRPDLAELLGTPTEVAKTASAGGGAITMAGGRKIPNPSTEIDFPTYTVTLEGTYDDVPVGDTATLLGDTQPHRTFLGRRAALYSDRTIRVRFRLDGGEATGTPGDGDPVRVLSVAQDPKDKGGSFDLALWRSDGGVPDDAVLLAVARKVLPTIPGWDAKAG
ncbi:DUF6215 domain-containing protein [Streptomyces beihaiensis]|uniref:DUF6215 domain-containing protein n=1 Tax=Streptomyces beihaiensis TaxID=2984495 RepID=A0ABT3TX43_9ACTN|nr:DUF6215 domain-containing protein [Streptomyces beihaiensis]MCX3061616.1 DUF6215 domain-containing protein [Streptomyces beihaiensis]